MTLLVEKWQGLLEAEGVPEIVTSGKKAIIARILDEQAKDLVSTKMLPENYEELMKEDANLTEANVSGDSGGDVAKQASGENSGNAVYPGATIMGIVRRAIPQMMAFDTIGVQPMNTPTSQIFVIRSIYGTEKDGDEAFAPGEAPKIHWSGSATKLSGGAGNVVPSSIAGSPQFADITATAPFVVSPATYSTGDYVTVDGDSGQRYYIAVADTSDAHADASAAVASGDLAEIGEGLITSVAELMQNFNGSTDNAWNEMSFRIDKQTVEARSRQLKAQYSMELSQDLKAVHGLDADTELSNILSNEIMVELNREVVQTLNVQAQAGASGRTATSTPGTFDISNSTDNRGARWAGEEYKSLLIQIEKEANEIGRNTGRGNGNWILASRNVVSALSMTDVFVSPAAQGMQNGTMNTDTNNSVFAGILGGRFKVYIDQYALEDYFIVGFKGATEMDASITYSPYVPLTPVRGADSKNMQPVIGFKTRYALGASVWVAPQQQQIFSQSLLRGIGANHYLRRVLVTNL